MGIGGYRVLFFVIRLLSLLNYSLRRLLVCRLVYIDLYVYTILYITVVRDLFFPFDNAEVEFVIVALLFAVQLNAF